MESLFQKQIERQDEAGIWLWCKNCNNVWLYRGRSNWYAPCSLCHHSVKVRNNGVRNMALTKASWVGEIALSLAQARKGIEEGVRK